MSPKDFSSFKSQESLVGAGGVNSGVPFVLPFSSYLNQNNWTLVEFKKNSLKIQYTENDKKISKQTLKNYNAYIKAVLSELVKPNNSNANRIS